MEHPKTEELRRFAIGMASRQEGRFVAAHLLQGCSACAATVQSFVAPPSIPKDAYAAMFQRLELRPGAAGVVQEDRESRRIAPQALLQELESHSGLRAEMLVRNSDRFLSVELTQLLLDHSHSLRYEDPHKMLRLAQLAVRIAERLRSEDPVKEQRLYDLRAACYSQLTHALRVFGHLAAAEEAFSSAHSSLHRGTGNPRARALVYECLGSLRTAQLRYQEAIHPYAAAVEIYRSLDRADSLGRALLGQAIAAGENGESEEALDLLFEAIPKVEGDPRLTLAACHAVVRFLIDSGRIDQAACRWIDLRTLYDKLEEPTVSIRAAWLEGLLLREGGRYPAALKLLESAHAGFQQHGLSYDAALVSLDMAVCYFRLGHLQKLRQALSEVMSLVGKHDVDRHTLVLFLSLKKAISGEPEAISPG
jgi:tetratricopeptide (TPR) repeat protein